MVSRRSHDDDKDGGTAALPRSILVSTHTCATAHGPGVSPTDIFSPFTVIAISRLTSLSDEVLVKLW